MKVCIVGASGKLGQYMIQHALDRGYEVVGVCREQSVPKLDAFKGRITVVPGPTDDREVIKRRWLGATACWSSWRRGASTTTHRERRRRCSTTRLRERAWCSRAAGTSRWMATTSRVPCSSSTSMPARNCSTSNGLEFQSMPELLAD
jgi:hypothetical protein